MELFSHYQCMKGKAVSYSRNKREFVSDDKSHHIQSTAFQLHTRLPETFIMSAAQLLNPKAESRVCITALVGIFSLTFRRDAAKL